MAEILRKSPVQFNISPQKTEVRENWTVALSYADEGEGPWLVDLSQKIRWDFQDANIDDRTVCDLAIPNTPGESILSDTILVNRMNGTQASIYHLGPAAPVMPELPGYTDVSEATQFLALFGPSSFSIAEKLTNLDFMDPTKNAPFLLQGPFCHLPCQIVTLEKTADRSGGFLLTCSRGYGDSMVDAILKAGLELGLRPAGEIRFNAWIEKF